MLYVTRFAVEGQGSFPTDMLRYDACYPESSEDAGKMDGFDHHKRTVNLRHVGPKGYTPTNARWESFSWRVVSTATHKLS